MHAKIEIIGPLREARNVVRTLTEAAERHSLHVYSLTVKGADASGPDRIYMVDFRTDDQLVRRMAEVFGGRD